MTFLQSHLGAYGEALAEYMTLAGEKLWAIAIIIIVYLGINKEAGIFTGKCVTLGMVCNPMLKNVILRRRPYFDNTSIKCLKPVSAKADIYNITAQGYSFPSGHSTNAAGLYFSLASACRKRAAYIIAALLTLLVGLSRPCLGVHYPTDVLVGWLMGLIIVFGMQFVYSRVKCSLIPDIIIMLLAPLGILICTTSDYYSGLALTYGFYLGHISEKTLIHFRDADKLIFRITRVLFGVIIFTVLRNSILDCTDIEMLQNARTRNFIAHFVAMFVVTGVYPLLFKPFEQIFHRNAQS